MTPSICNLRNLFYTSLLLALGPFFVKPVTAYSTCFSSYESCEWLYWTYQHAGYDFAIETEGWYRSPIAFLKGYPKGKKHSATSQFSSGVRLTEGVNFFSSPLFIEMQVTYVPFSEQSIVKGTALAPITLPTTIASSLPADRIKSSRTLRYGLADLLLRFDNPFACGLEMGGYVGLRAMMLLQKWSLSHSHTFDKPSSKVEWNMKMGNLGGTLGLRAGYQYSKRLSCSAHIGASLVKGMHGSSYLNWNLNISSDNVHLGSISPSSRSIFGWDASVNIEAVCFRCLPSLRLMLGYEIQQWLRIQERDHYDFVSTYHYTKYSPLTMHGLTLGLLLSY